MYRQIENCRICGAAGLTDMLDLGNQYLTGVFPKQRNEPITCGPLILCLCERCALVQLRHSYDLGELYGTNYGYRSGLNQSMVKHLGDKIESIKRLINLSENDIVIDIGSNDGTTLSFYPPSLKLVGFDPSAEKFAKYYRKDITLITDFFSAERFRSDFGSSKAKVITSIAMFYDLEDPQNFVDQIASILASDGIWHFEQSYLPSMLHTNAYDTICHEHLEYYGLKQIKWMTDRAGLKIVDVGFNDINGGSFFVTTALANAPYPECSAPIAQILEQEQCLGLHTHAPYEAFRSRVIGHRSEFRDALNRFRTEGRKVVGYGASTKGNVILQFCGITEEDIPCIAEVNESKFGCFTPGTNIPIISEAVARSMKPDVFVVLPWHFKRNIMAREAQFLKDGGRLFFPLPELNIVDHS